MLHNELMKKRHETVETAKCEYVNDSRKLVDLLDSENNQKLIKDLCKPFFLPDGSENGLLLIDFKLQEAGFESMSDFEDKRELEVAAKKRNNITVFVEMSTNPKKPDLQVFRKLPKTEKEYKDLTTKALVTELEKLAEQKNKKLTQVATYKGYGPNNRNAPMVILLENGDVNQEVKVDKLCSVDSSKFIDWGLSIVITLEDLPQTMDEAEEDSVLNIAKEYGSDLKELEEDSEQILRMPGSNV